MGRHFYEDDELIVNKPGTIDPITSKLKQQESIHGENASIVDGMVIRTTPNLEKYSNKFRQFIISKFNVFEAELQTQKLAGFNEWQNLKSNFNSIVKEPVLPNAIYILTAGLTGSILVCNRNIAVRFVTPLVFGGVATQYFMPRTFDNLMNQYDEFEVENVPEVFARRQELLRQLRQWRHDANVSRLQFNDCVIEQVHDLRMKWKDVWK